MLFLICSHFLSNDIIVGNKELIKLLEFYVDLKSHLQSSILIIMWKFDGLLFMINNNKSIHSDIKGLLKLTIRLFEKPEESDLTTRLITEE